MLRRPDYVVWMLREAPDGVVGGAFLVLLDQFDAAPVQGGCEACGVLPAMAFALPNQAVIVRLCTDCASTGDGGGLVRIDGFWGALAHIEATLVRGRRLGLRRIIRSLALAKGAPRRLTENAALRFFGQAPARPSRPQPLGSTHHDGNPLSRR
ncbi:hypothetical protein ACETK8_20170 (plasmid) [Brevundimonas staleyi]|uniref:Uncharacterized protein n=1 Tax=Brevundimonas staleyi TaxID=74326 RepID=A0ABW0FMA4_9CAUL